MRVCDWLDIHCRHLRVAWVAWVVVARGLACSVLKPWAPQPRLHQQLQRNACRNTHLQPSKPAPCRPGMPPPGAPAAAPTGGPLFPAAAAGGAPPPAGGALFPVAANAAPAAAAAAKPAGPTVDGLIWTDEECSQEERRAQLPKYAAKPAGEAAPAGAPGGPPAAAQQPGASGPAGMGQPPAQQSYPGGPPAGQPGGPPAGMPGGPMGPPPGMPPQQQAQHGPPGMAPPQGFAPPMVSFLALQCSCVLWIVGCASEEARHAGWQHVISLPWQQHQGTPSPLTPACLALCLAGPATRPSRRRHAAPAAAPRHGRPSGHAHAAPASGHGWRAHGSAPWHAAAAGHAARPHAGDCVLTAALCSAVPSTAAAASSCCASCSCRSGAPCAACHPTDATRRRRTECYLHRNVSPACRASRCSSSRCSRQ